MLKLLTTIKRNISIVDEQNHQLYSSSRPSALSVQGNAREKNGWKEANENS